MNETTVQNNKRIVNYTGKAILSGNRAILIPVNHPDTTNVQNGEFATTSKVLQHDEQTGRIETLNTIYVRI